MKNSYYLVVGLGKTGWSIARYLRHEKQSFAVFDTRSEIPNLTEFQREFETVDIYSETIPIDLYQKVSAFICSPGVSLSHPVVMEAKLRGIPLLGDIELFAQSVTGTVLAITGTNGKSTVTTLVSEMAKAAGYKVACAGNIGTPVLDMLLDNEPYEIWVLELSSFQLELLHSLKPKVAAILNITPDHLDRHGDFQTYQAMKHRIYEHAESVVYNREDESTKPCSVGLLNAIHFALNEPAEGHFGLRVLEGQTWLARGGELFLATKALALQGTHNWENVLAACAIANQAGIPFSAMVDVLQTFSGLPHRCQWVRTIDGVDYLNDSKGTNVGATVSAIVGTGSRIHGKIVLLAGGMGKGALFDDLTPVARAYLRSAILFGEDANTLKAVLSQVVPVIHADSFEKAILYAKQVALPGDVVLLSPACASFDMFSDFNERGERFCALVTQL